MNFSSRVCQMLHEEHMSTVDMLNGLENVLATGGRGAPDLSEPSKRAELQAAVHLIDREVGSHFSFEEDELFTRLADYGDTAIGAHLTEEHQAILPIAKAVSEEAARALNDGFTDEDWQAFRAQAAELIERLLAHIQKEEMALLPVLDDVLDTETDFTLSEAHANH